MRRTTSLVILVLALTLGGFAAFLAKNWIQSHSVETGVQQTGTIVVANDVLTFGTAITTDNVREIAWASEEKPAGAFAHVQDLIKDGRRVVLSPFVRDEPIVAGKVGGPNARASLSTVIQPGMRAVTVQVDDVRGVAGFIFPGDFVDIALTRTGGATGSVSDVILQHVKVLAIDQVQNERQENPRVARAVTLEVTQEQALKILLATNVGRLSLVLRQAAEVAVAPQSRVTESDLYTGEAPAPPPAPSEPLAAAAPADPTDSDLRKVTIVRAMKGEEYEVPRDIR